MYENEFRIQGRYGELVCQTAHAEEHRSSLHAHVAEQIEGVRGAMQHSMQNEVPSFVGAMLTHTGYREAAGSQPQRGGVGSQPPHGGGKEKIDLADTTHTETSGSGPIGDRSLVGYVVLDATRVREMEGDAPQVTIPLPLLSHLVQTVVNYGTSEEFRVQAGSTRLDCHSFIRRVTNVTPCGESSKKALTRFSWFFTNKGR
jgi:hypothetical protein